MKKLKLQALGLSVNELLTREQMKKVSGGCGTDPVSTCSATAECQGCRQASCTGKTTCTSTDNSGVKCDGVFSRCLTPKDKNCI